MADVSSAKENVKRAFYVRSLNHPNYLEIIATRPEIRLEELVREGVVEAGHLRREDLISIESAIKYEGYLKQQDREVEKLRRAEAKRIPDDMDYASMAGLSREIVEKLTRIRPRSVAQASRIPGITPASITILLLHLEMRSRRTEPECVA